MEAFLEAYHISTTHGHTIRFANDFDCQYDLFGPNVSRLLQAIGIPATALQGTVPPAEIARTVQKMLPAADRVADIPDDVDARAFLGERFRQSYAKRWGVDLSAASDAELLDSIQYFLFPNFAPWMGWSLPIAYRFRPWSDDPGQSLMEIMLLHPVGPGASQEPAAEHWLELLLTQGVPAGKVRTLDDVYDWEQTRSQGLLLEVEHPSYGALTLPGSALRFDDNAFSGGREHHEAPPLLGQHSAAIRAWLDS